MMCRVVLLIILYYSLESNVDSVPIVNKLDTGATSSTDPT